MSKVIFVISLCGMLFALCFPVEAQQAVTAARGNEAIKTRPVLGSGTTTRLAMPLVSAN